MSVDLRIATFNIYFFAPTSSKHQVDRSDDDLDLIGRVIAELDADVVVLQEIMGLEALSQPLDVASKQAKRRYLFRDEHGLRVASPWKGKGNKIVVAYDADRLRVVRHGRVPGYFTEKRRPLVVVLEELATGASFAVIGVHLKSDLPTYDNGEQDRRYKECRILAEWLDDDDAVADTIGGPLPRAWVLTGDFNAVRESPVLEPVRAVAALHAPETANQPGDTWTTAKDKVVIDHFATPMDAPIAVSAPPKILRHDIDPVIVEALGGDPQDESYEVKVYDHKEWVFQMCRVSDHRPVVASVRVD